MSTASVYFCNRHIKVFRTCSFQRLLLHVRVLRFDNIEAILDCCGHFFRSGLLKPIFSILQSLDVSRLRNKSAEEEDFYIQTAMTG